VKTKLGGHISRTEKNDKDIAGAEKWLAKHGKETEEEEKKQLRATG